MTWLESFVGFPEISQWPLDFITRFHVHVLRNTFTFAFAYDMFGFLCELSRNQSMAPRFYYSDSCTCERPPFERRDKDRDRQRQTDNQRQIDRQTEGDRESQTGRLTDIKTQRETTRKTDSQTEALLYVSPFLALSVPC